VPELVEREQLPHAIALSAIPWQAGRMVPSITGLLIAAFGGAVGFLLAAAASYVALVLYGRLRIRGLAAASSASRSRGSSWTG